jgi:predicted RNA-binding protein associated with RNAse of E/G family
MQIETIHESLLNGQRRQMVEQIDEYGVTDFHFDYGRYLMDTYEKEGTWFEYYTDVAQSYHRIKNR